MSIEENEDSAVRGLLGTAFADPEPPLRDLASGSIARGDAVRRRNRVFAAGGAALSAVAVVGTFAVVTGATPAKRGDQNPANTVTSAATSASPKGYLGFGPGAVGGGIAKSRDIATRLPALLQPLLPNGVTVRQTPGSTLLTGPTGTNQASMWVGLAPARTDVIHDTVCPYKGTSCQTKTVAGGTVYLDESSGTAAEAAHEAGWPADVLKPGTAQTLVGKALSMTFVPTDRTKYAFNFTVSTALADLQFRDHVPSDYPTGFTWPPKVFPPRSAYDPSGLLVSPDDLVGMLTKPGLDKVEYLLDPRTAVSQETKSKIESIEARIVAAAAPALPSGVKVSVGDSSFQTGMIVTGPSGENRLRWSVDVQSTQYRQQPLGWCPPNVTCTKRAVPGGRLVVWAQKPTDSNLTVLSNTPSSYDYWFLPDDTSKPALSMTLETSAEATGQPGHSELDPGHTYSVSDGPYFPAQVSADQFLAAAENGQLATAVHQTTPLLGALE